MNLFQLEYFRVLAQTQHYTQAAKLLSIAQPSLTHSIKNLEKELNVSLFNKKGRNITLNKYGEFFLQHIDTILNDLEESKKQLQVLVDPTYGTINLNYIYSLGPHFIPNIISRFYQNSANNKILFNLFEGTTMGIIENFINNKADLAFTAKIEEKNITCLPIFKEDLCLITPPHHALAQYQEIELSQILNYPFITYYAKSGIRKIINNLFEDIGLFPHVAFQVADDHAACGFVANNLGIAIVPKFQGISNYKVCVLPIKAPSCERIIYLSYLTDSYLSPPIAKFKEFILTTFPT
ncbi:MAG: LysR family transcriptional regulator [Firmicutes bacterium]|nr:LysR family transcriptional regulator [Bacillota bacterium]